jgi:hypothetical protein
MQPTRPPAAVQPSNRPPSSERRQPPIGLMVFSKMACVANKRLFGMTRLAHTHAICMSASIEPSKFVQIQCLRKIRACMRTLKLLNYDALRMRRWNSRSAIVGSNATAVDRRPAV